VHRQRIGAPPGAVLPVPAALRDLADVDLGIEVGGERLAVAAGVRIDDVEQLQKAIDAFGERRGSGVTTWTELLLAGALREVPRDPSGTSYRLTPESRVELSPGSPLLPLPIEPETRPAP